MAEQLHTAGRIRDVTNIRDFIKLPGEEVEDSAEDLIKQVAELYAGPDRDAETDKDSSEQPQIKLNKALQALQKLRLYKEQQEDSKRDLITALIRHERRIQSQRARNTKQKTITTYFSVADCLVLTLGMQI